VLTPPQSRNDVRPSHEHRQESAMTVPTEQQARTVIAPWYALFNVATRGDV
jgi:hypothetical protein